VNLRRGRGEFRGGRRGGAGWSDGSLRFVSPQQPDECLWVDALVGIRDANDPEAYYSIAVIDWTQAYQPRMEERNKLGLKPEDSLAAKDKKVCQEVQTKNTPFVDEGMQMLNKAIELRPDYDDAMAYLNLMWREKADIECGDTAARTQDLKTADEWVDKTLAVKKAKAEKAGPAGGIVNDTDQK